LTHNKYNRKTDIAIDSLDTFIKTYKDLKDHYRQTLVNVDPKVNPELAILNILDVQNAINTSILELVYSMMPQYDKESVPE
jgi:hypothetical protein